MGIFGRALRGAEAGAIAALGVALSFFVLDLIRLQPLATPGALSGAAFGPGGLELDLTSMSGLVAGLSTAFRIATFTVLHFLAFALVGVVASFLFDWKRRAGLEQLLTVAVLCTAAFSATGAVSGSVVALESLGPVTVGGVNLFAALLLGPVTVGGVNLFAALLLLGYLRLAAMPEPEEGPPA